MSKGPRQAACRDSGRCFTRNTFSLSAEIARVHHCNPYFLRGNTCHLNKVKGRWYELDELIQRDWGPQPLPRVQGMSLGLGPWEGCWVGARAGRAAAQGGDREEV